MLHKNGRITFTQNGSICKRFIISYYSFKNLDSAIAHKIGRWYFSDQTIIIILNMMVVVTNN